MNWQPIETAPKDGTEIVLWCSRREQLIHPAKWFKNKWCEYTIDDFDSMGWQSLKVYDEPTHWFQIIPPKIP